MARLVWEKGMLIFMFYYLKVEEINILIKCLIICLLININHFISIDKKNSQSIKII